MASHKVLIPHVAPGGLLLRAAWLSVAAARVELAARGRVCRARHVPREDDARLDHVRVGAWHCRQQGLGVGVFRLTVNARRSRKFHDVAQVHHGDAVADILDYGQVVRHEEISQGEGLLQVVQQVEHLRLDRHVQRRDRFVADDQFRAQRQGAGDPDPLTLTAGECVWVAVHVLNPQPDQFQEFARAMPQFLAAGQPVHDQRLGHDLHHRHARVQRRVRILEDDLHLSPKGDHLPAGQMRDVHHLPVQPVVHRAGGRRVLPQDQAPEGGLAAARLAHQPQRLPLSYEEADAVHRPNVAHRAAKEPPLDREPLLESFDLQQNRSLFRHGHLA